MKARVEIEAADLHQLRATGNIIEDGGWQVYCGDYHLSDTVMYITAKDAWKASRAFIELARRLEALDEAARPAPVLAAVGAGSFLPEEDTPK